MGSSILACLHCGQINRLPSERLSQQPRCGVCGAALIEAKPVEVDFAVLDKAARNDTLPLLVDFWAPWCGPCRAMAPEYHKAAATLQGRARLAKIDTEAHPEASARWAIRGIPAFILFRGGREAGRLAGARPAAQLAEWVEAQLNGGPGAKDA